MYDAITPSRIPAEAEIVASYVSGQWPNYIQLANLFPTAKRLSIATNVGADADCLDVERYDATAAQAPAWVASQRRRGNLYPWVYMSASMWPDVRDAFSKSKTDEPYYWVANYDDGPIIPPGAIAVQYKSTPGYDMSVVTDESIPGFDTDSEDTMSAAEQTALENFTQEVVRNNAKWLQTVAHNQTAAMVAAIEASTKTIVEAIKASRK